MDLVEEVKTLDQFDHMVVIVDLPSGPVLYDPSDKYMPILQVPRTVPRARALRVTGNDEHVWFTVPNPLPEKNGASINRTVAFDGEAFCLVTEEAVFAGAFAAFLREGYSNVQNQDRVFALQSIMAGSGIRVNVESVEIANLEDFQEPLQIRYTYKMRNPLHRGTGRKRVDLEGTWETTLMPPLGDDPERMQEVYLHMPLLVTVNTRIQLPDGMQVNPNSFEKEYGVSNDLGLIQRVCESTGNGVNVAYKALIHSGKLPAATFPKVVDLSEAVQETSRLSFETFQ
jgi:hypothetical protein